MQTQPMPSTMNQGAQDAHYSALKIVTRNVLPARFCRTRWLTRLASLDWGTILAFTLPFCLYILTLAPTVYNLDSAELTTAVATNGLVRATGYPLYLLLGKFWALLPLGDMGYRMNLMSAFLAALTIALAERVLRRQGVTLWARLGALGLLATAPYFWSLSLIAEVYTLHTALMAMLILWLMRWAERPTAQGLAVAVCLTAVSLGNHAATVLLLPAFTFFVLFTSPNLLRRPQTWFWVSAALAAGLSLYLLLPWRYLHQPAFNYVGSYDAQGNFTPTNLLSLTNLLWLMTGRTFAGQMLGYSSSEIGRETIAFVYQLGRAFFAVGVGPGLLGLIVWLRRDWRQGTMLLLIFTANAIFYINYRVVDKNTMFLPAYLVWTLWLGTGYQALLHWLSQATNAAARARMLLRTVLLISVIAATAWTWHLVDLSDDWSTRELGESILKEAAPEAIIFGWWDTVPVLQYLQLVEGMRPDVTLINRFLINGDDMEAFIIANIASHPIYINNPPVAFLRNMQVESLESIYRLLPRGDAQALPKAAPDKRRQRRIR